MESSVREIKEIFSDLIVDVIGNLNEKVTGIGSLQKSQANDILFIFKESRLPDAINANAQTIVVPTKSKNLLPTTSKKTFLLSPNPEIAMATIASKLFAPKMMG